MAKRTSGARSTGGSGGSKIRRATAASRRYSGEWTPSMGTPF